ncbi:MAG: 50S ribosomal protein L7 [Clostridium sp.]|nr:50S ribosomal protein L7 [Clostridium sp.]
MLHDPVLHLIGLAHKAGRLEIGEEPVGAVCRSRHAKLILLASDAAPNTCRRAAHFGQAGNALFLHLPFTKAELGFRLGRSSCAMLALTDSGFAAAIVEKLAVRDPEYYGPAAQQLRVKADRAYQRQREKRQHEKNLRAGKKKPWAPPPKASPSPPSPPPGPGGRMTPSPPQKCRKLTARISGVPACLR